MTKRRTWTRELLREHFPVGKFISDDESQFSLRGPSKFYKTYQGKSDHARRVKTPAHPRSVTCYACFVLHYKSKMIFPKKKVDSHEYARTNSKLLKKKKDKWIWRERILLTDNSPWHTSKKTSQFLKKQTIQVKPLPTLSPDIHLIETSWAMPASRLYTGGRTYADEKKLKKAITKEWKALPQEKLDNLATSFAERLADVLEAHGDITSN